MVAVLPPENPALAERRAGQLARLQALNPGVSADDLAAANLRRRTEAHSERERAVARAQAISRVQENTGMAPRERWQRGSEADVEVDGPVRIQRELTGLLQLQRAGTIGGAKVAAALRWRASCELSVHGASNPQRSGSGGGGVGMWMVARIDVTTRYRQALGRRRPRRLPAAPLRGRWPQHHQDGPAAGG